MNATRIGTSEVGWWVHSRTNHQIVRLRNHCICQTTNFKICMATFLVIQKNKEAMLNSRFARVNNYCWTNKSRNEVGKHKKPRKSISKILILLTTNHDLKPYSSLSHYHLIVSIKCRFLGCFHNWVNCTFCIHLSSKNLFAFLQKIPNCLSLRSVHLFEST